MLKTVDNLAALAADLRLCLSLFSACTAQDMMVDGVSLISDSGYHPPVDFSPSAREPGQVVPISDRDHGTLLFTLCMYGKEDLVSVAGHSVVVVAAH